MFIEAYRPRLMQNLTAKTPLGGLFAKFPSVFLADRVLRPAINEVFGPNTKPADGQWRQLSEILSYNDGRIVMHKVGRFVVDRYHHRNRWVGAMRATGVPMRLIDGPCDPNSGRHMAERYAELIPDADVVYLDDEIGHWPQLEDPQGVLRHFFEFVRGRASHEEHPALP
jgi:pimeloyl-ACP methyl ester carboxylesterase